MTLHQRLHPDPRHTPDNVVPFDRTERRTKARWVERKEEMGLPVQDSTSRIVFIGRGPDAA